MSESAGNTPFIEEDDEFEEFENEWTQKQEDSDDKQRWQADWDDDEDDSNFAKQLRAELAKE